MKSCFAPPARAIMPRVDTKGKSAKKTTKNVYGDDQSADLEEHGLRLMRSMSNTSVGRLHTNVYTAFQMIANGGAYDIFFFFFLVPCTNSFVDSIC